MCNYPHIMRPGQNIYLPYRHMLYVCGEFSIVLKSLGTIADVSQWSDRAVVFDIWLYKDIDFTEPQTSLQRPVKYIQFLKIIEYFDPINKKTRLWKKTEGIGIQFIFHFLCIIASSFFLHHILCVKVF